MSEYQYYEFQAIDRPLSEKEMAELRSHSTRARITPTSFVNDYSWGGFKSDENAWLAKYFDAFLYLANWGTHILKLRLPTRLLDADTAGRYCAGEHAWVREKNGKVILTFQSEDEESGEWIEGEGQLASLISVRAELARGDRRALYLGWLLCAQSGDLDDEEVEPPVPAGLGQLSASLESLAEFLRVDTDLFQVAATASPPLADREPKPAEIRQWLARLPVAKKDDLLVRLLGKTEGLLVDELLQQVRREGAAEQGTATAATERRTVARASPAGRESRRGAAAHRGGEGGPGESTTRTRGRDRPSTAPRCACGPGARDLEAGRRLHRQEAAEELRPSRDVARGSPGPRRTQGRGVLPAACRGIARCARAQTDAHRPPTESGVVT